MDFLPLPTPSRSAAPAAAAEVQTELAARVAGWRSKMAPALEEEDARPEFDIHAYGERILERMAGLTCAGAWLGGAACWVSWLTGAEPGVPAEPVC